MGLKGMCGGMRWGRLKVDCDGFERNVRGNDGEGCVECDEV